MLLIQKSLYLHFTPSDAVRLGPVYFRVPNNAIFDTDHCDTFHLAPSARSKLLSQPHNVADAATNGDRLDSFNRADYFEIH